MPPKSTPEIHNLRMIVFDVEGVVLPRQRFLLEEMSLLSSRDQSLILFNAFLYETGLRPLKQTMERIYSHFKGISIDDFSNTFEKISLVPNAIEVFHRLKNEGYLIALISSGIPESFLRRLAEKLEADYVVGPILDVQENRLTGRISGQIIEPDGKKAALSQVLKKASIPPSACAVVADDRNNLAMFCLGVLRIGFNPDFILTTQSDYVVKGNLDELLPILLSMPPVTTPRRGLRKVREMIHVGSFIIPFLCQFLGVSRFFLTIIIALVSLGYVLGELARFKGRSLPPFTTLTELAATDPERWEYATAPLFLAIGVVLCLVIFPPAAGNVGIIVVTLGDGVAKIVGRQWGKITIPFNKPKKVEGTLAGLTVSALVASLFIDPTRAILAASSGMVAEAIPTPVNDNLLVSVTVGLVSLIPL